MGKYGLVNRTKISNAIDTGIYNEFMELHTETQVPISKLLDKAIKLLLKEYSK